MCCDLDLLRKSGDIGVFPQGVPPFQAVTSLGFHTFLLIPLGYCGFESHGFPPFRYVAALEGPNLPNLHIYCCDFILLHQVGLFEIFFQGVARFQISFWYRGCSAVLLCCGLGFLGKGSDVGRIFRGVPPFWAVAAMEARAFPLLPLDHCGLKIFQGVPPFQTVAAMSPHKFSFLFLYHCDFVLLGRGVWFGRIFQGIPPLQVYF